MEDYGQQHGIDSFVKHEVSWAFLTNLCNKIIVEHQHVPEEKRTLPGRKNQDRMEHTVNEYYNLSTERAAELWNFEVTAAIHDNM